MLEIYYNGLFFILLQFLLCVCVPNIRVVSVLEVAAVVTVVAVVVAILMVVAGVPAVAI